MWSRIKSAIISLFNRRTRGPSPEEKAFAALVELQWFITEQVEEERTFLDAVAKIKMVADDPSAVLDLDREMGARGGGGGGGGGGEAEGEADS